MAVCRSCDAEIVWLKTAGGKIMPVNASLRAINKHNGGWPGLRPIRVTISVDAEI